MLPPDLAGSSPAKPIEKPTTTTKSIRVVEASEPPAPEKKPLPDTPVHAVGMQTLADQNKVLVKDRTGDQSSDGVRLKDKPAVKPGQLDDISYDEARDLRIDKNGRGDDDSTVYSLQGAIADDLLVKAINAGLDKKEKDKKEDEESDITYTIQKGDTLEEITRALIQNNLSTKDGNPFKGSFNPEDFDDRITNEQIAKIEAKIAERNDIDDINLINAGEDLDLTGLLHARTDLSIVDKKKKDDGSESEDPPTLAVLAGDAFNVIKDKGSDVIHNVIDAFRDEDSDPPKLQGASKRGGKSPLQSLMDAGSGLVADSFTDRPIVGTPFPLNFFTPSQVPGMVEEGLGFLSSSADNASDALRSLSPLPFLFNSGVETYKNGKKTLDVLSELAESVPQVSFSFGVHIG